MSENKLAQVFHFDLYGKRDAKYDFLNNNSLDSIDWNELELKEPNFFLVRKDFGLVTNNNYFQIEKLFVLQNSGLTTEFDELAIQNSYEHCKQLYENLTIKDSKEIERFYQLGHTKLKKISAAIKDIKDNEAKIKLIYYRPFDNRYTIYTGKVNGLMGRPRNGLMKHFRSENCGLVIGRQGQAVGSMPWNVLTVTNSIVDCNIFYRGRGTVFPLYLYPEANEQADMFAVAERTPNLNAEIVKQIADKLQLEFEAEKSLQKHARSKCVDEDEKSTLTSCVFPHFAPIDILDYIYAVLHSPSYREKYKEFLKIDFPRVPYPKDKETFWKLVNLGREIRQIHLLESAKVTEYITQYPIDGDNVVGKVRFEAGKVWINETQYFDNVPEIAWQFYIGGYQPAQKWLKDRKERVLNFEDIFHYQKIIVALAETDKLMKKIDAIEIE